MPRKRSVDPANAASRTGSALAVAKRKSARKPAAAPAAADPVPETLAALSAAAGFTVGEREEIERLAYSYWEERGCPGDSPDEDWFRAEAEVRSRRTE
jgi:hypothetical protein